MSVSWHRWWMTAALSVVAMTGLAAEKDSAETSKAVPIVMEAATVRGKVAVLETRWEDRQIMKGLRVQVWSTKTPEKPQKPSRHSPTVHVERDTLLHETETDDLGLFDLPVLDVGEYLLAVSEVRFLLTVIPKSAERAGQSEPKVLLILIPKEVISTTASEEAR